MVFSVKANKNKIIAVIILLAILICSAIFLPKITIPTTQNFMGDTLDARVSFLNSFGWQVNSEPVVERDVTIPQDFSEVYAKYNVMQQAQGFDLMPYRGVVCTQYIYLVENYPVENVDIHATLLVYEGEIIGGDISSTQADGFMHGFAKDSQRYGE